MTTFGFIGAGNMAGAIVRGTVQAGTDPADVVVADPDPRATARLAQELGIKVATSNRDVVESCDFVVLAVKPQVLAPVLADLRAELAAARPAVVSIAAGQTVAHIEAMLPAGTPLVRVMPNVNAMIGEGMAAVCPGSRASAEHVAEVVGLMGTVGQVVELPEKDFPAFQALAACGPAFVFTFIEALARGGLKNGLPKAVAVRVAAQMVLGSARLVLERGEEGVTPAALTDMVTSPAGTTIAGLVAAEERGFSPAVIAAVEAAIRRDRELGG